MSLDFNQEHNYHPFPVWATNEKIHLGCFCHLRLQFKTRFYCKARQLVYLGLQNPTPTSVVRNGPLAVDERTPYATESFAA